MAFPGNLETKVLRVAGVNLAFSQERQLVDTNYRDFPGLQRHVSLPIFMVPTRPREAAEIVAESTAVW